jgi:hypothetical protein
MTRPWPSSIGRMQELVFVMVPACDILSILHGVVVSILVRQKRFWVPPCDASVAWGDVFCLQRRQPLHMPLLDVLWWGGIG